MSSTFLVTTEEYDRMVEKGAFDHLPGKIELIRGEVHRMNPAGPLHDDVIVYLTDWSFRSADRTSIRVSVQTGLSVVQLHSRPEPDLMWIRAARYRQQHPTVADVKLAIEVSDSSLQADLIDKAALYAEAGIVEYWVVDLLGKCVHVFRDPREGVYRHRSVAKVGEELMPLVPSSMPLNLNDLFE